VYSVEEPRVYYREAAESCRKAGRSSTSPKEWIVMAEQWEWLADTADGSWLLPSKGRKDRSERAPDYLIDRPLGNVPEKV
jgi:hypothetical protein